jgi:hypothetical protein
MSPAGSRAGSATSKTAQRSAFSAAAMSWSRSIRGPGALPGVDAFADQPHAHDVAEVADSSVDAALVGEVRDAALFGEDGLVELDTD